ncbi:carboxymuconolactone decarboxylase family protein [Sneathiella limimaris]|uniref:carboxymuconolactone decarboxylase family protein n=1 Tax=Sneathiella limimaris TaxID=1964213 RepID=UPI00146CB265|nr:carboxymuconolactone decarboxylase family protein [Sneathiella limimaris]
MLKHIYKWKFREFGAEYNYDMSYMEELAEIYPEKASYYVKAMPLANHNGHLPLDLYYAIKVRSMQIGDCGPCLKLTLTMAERSGISKDDLKRLLTGDMDGASRYIKLGWSYATAVLKDGLELEELIREIEIEFGKRGLWDASLAVVYGQFYPILKKGLGVATVCSPVSVLLEEMSLAS